MLYIYIIYGGIYSENVTIAQINLFFFFFFYSKNIFVIETLNRNRENLYNCNLNRMIDKHRCFDLYLNKCVAIGQHT